MIFDIAESSCMQTAGRRPPGLTRHEAEMDNCYSKMEIKYYVITEPKCDASLYVTGFVKIDPNHTGTEIYFIAEY